MVLPQPHWHMLTGSKPKRGISLISNIDLQKSSLTICTSPFIKI